ncbi:cytochrome c maturation protein CcmE [Adlercreutzia sp. ZJ154]|uniref:cytochrome c maturation protein CcmE domain-containing protein n=1 Tax=Adlercreutzia sp. ZJ154 TaxID=2709790 RepID=UPI001F153818|nr:cytochrome c maturation protein CcmE [Adlercreutzia sp. ZJ154]
MILINAKMKKRLIAVSGVVVIAIVLALAFVGSGTAAKTMSVAEAAENPQAGQKVQVSGNVVPNSYDTSKNVLTFKIYDPNGSPEQQLSVRYEGAAASTFGNDVTAICTGRIGDDGTLMCTELVTKCPSKYENADSALTVERLLEYGNEVTGKVVKVAGEIEPDTMKAAGQSERFYIKGNGDARIAVVFDGPLSDEIVSGARVVLTGSVDESGKFQATDVALEG